MCEWKDGEQESSEKRRASDLLLEQIKSRSGCMGFPRLRMTREAMVLHPGIRREDKRS